MAEKAAQDLAWNNHRKTGDYQTLLRKTMDEQQAILDEVPGESRKVSKEEIERALRIEYFASTPGGGEFAGFSSPDF